MGYSDIASVAEPWILLPLVYSFKVTGTISEYSHRICQIAHEDFIANFPNGYDDYYDSMRDLVLDLYKKQCSNNECYFLDKTPRYYLIISEIAQIFPDAKFIFLFRNFAHIYSSILKTWGKSSFKQFHANHIDLYEGPKHLSEGYKLLKNRAYALKYEDFVINPQKHTEEICKYLNIKYDSHILNQISSQNTNGRLGDSIGIKRYKEISQDSLNKWSEVFNTYCKKKFLYRYINSIDEEIFVVQGYSKNEILEDIKQIDVNRFGVYDFIDWLKSMLIIKFKLNLFFGKSMQWTNFKFLN